MGSKSEFRRLDFRNVLRSRAVSGSPAFPAAVEQLDVAGAPIAQNPPDSSRPISRLIVVNNGARVRVDTKLADERLPFLRVLALGKGLAPGVVIDPDGIGNMAGLVVALGAAVQDTKLLGNIRLHQLGRLQKKIGAGITVDLRLVSRSDCTHENC